jgi:hypothetical protein
MQRQVCAAIMPALSLPEVFGSWRNITAQLAEPPRRRSLDAERIPKSS